MKPQRTQNCENLLKDCRSGDLDRQVAAILELQKSECYQAVPLLVDLLNSPEWNIRSLAAEALGILGDEESDEVGAALIKLLSDPEMLVRDEAIYALFELRYTPAYRPILELLNGDPCWVVRASSAEALCVLAEVGNINVLEGLKSALDYPIEPVRFYAAYSLGLLGTPELLPELEIYLSSEESLTVKAALLEARYRLGAKEALPKLLKLLDYAEDEHLPRVIFDSLDGLLEDEVDFEIPSDLLATRKALQETRNFPFIQAQKEKLIAKIESLLDERELV